MKSIAEIMAESLKSKGLGDIAKLTPQERMKRKIEKENAKLGNLHLSDGYVCEKCNNKGIILVAKEYDGLWQDVQRDCECMRIRRNIRNLKKSGLANVVEDFKLEKFKVDKPFQELMLNTATNYLDNGDGKWLAFLGASGSGKTMLCSAVAVELLKRGKELKYMLWKDDSRKIKNNNFDGDGTLIDYYKSVEVLYIDDLFKTGKTNGEFQKPTAGDINLAFEIINNRVAQKKVTIISSENTIDELFEIDEAVAGRIKQMCGEYCLNISKGEGKNYRKRDL
jgi:DNA replication protein DnaC